MSQWKIIHRFFFHCTLLKAWNRSGPFNFCFLIRHLTTEVINIEHYISNLFFFYSLHCARRLLSITNALSNSILNDIEKLSNEKISIIVAVRCGFLVSKIEASQAKCFMFSLFMKLKWQKTSNMKKIFFFALS